MIAYRRSEQVVEWTVRHLARLDDNITLLSIYHQVVRRDVNVHYKCICIGAYAQCSDCDVCTQNDLGARRSYHRFSDYALTTTANPLCSVTAKCVAICAKSCPKGVAIETDNRNPSSEDWSTRIAGKLSTARVTQRVIHHSLRTWRSKLLLRTPSCSHMSFKHVSASILHVCNPLVAGERCDHSLLQQHLLPSAKDG